MKGFERQKKSSDQKLPNIVRTGQAGAFAPPTGIRPRKRVRPLAFSRQLPPAR